jgi:protein-tyrosine phosphatase
MDIDYTFGYSELFSNKASKITDEIYQGNFESAKNKEYLLTLGITHILVAGKLEKCHPHDFVYRTYDIDDLYTENIMKYFEDGYKFIDECIIKGGRILIHCAAGISRSSTFTLCYLMKKHLLTYDEAYKILKKGRSIAFPNPGFQMQLCDWYDKEVRSFRKKIIEKS